MDSHPNFNLTIYFEQIFKNRLKDVPIFQSVFICYIISLFRFQNRNIFDIHS